MRKYIIQLDTLEQYMLEKILIDLIDKSNLFTLETLAEHSVAVYESQKWLLKLCFKQKTRVLRLTYYQVPLLWKILMLYPPMDSNIIYVRQLLGQLDNYLQTIQTNLNYEVPIKVYPSAANQLVISSTDY